MTKINNFENWFISGLKDIEDYHPREWIIKNIIPQGSSIVGFVGESGSGKSCVVYDIMMNYITGSDNWLGLPMKGEDRTCVFLSSEGDYKRRLKGWLLKHGFEGEKLQNYEKSILRLDTSKMSVGIALTSNTISELRKQIKTQFKTVGLIVIDTLNGFFSGEENNNTDMGNFLGNIDKDFAKAFNSCVIIIHHLGKKAKEQRDSTGRGASSFNAKLDMNISIEGKPLTGITLEVQKARDSKEGIRYRLKAEPITLTPEEETTIVLSELSELDNSCMNVSKKTPFDLIQEGIIKHEIKVFKERIIHKEDIKKFLSLKGGNDGQGFKGNGIYAQISPNKSGVIGKLVKDELLEPLDNNESFQLVDRNSYVWKLEE